jgi:hypothetical protein
MYEVKVSHKHLGTFVAGTFDSYSQAEGLAIDDLMYDKEKWPTLQIKRLWIVDTANNRIRRDFKPELARRKAYLKSIGV